MTSQKDKVISQSNDVKYKKIEGSLYLFTNHMKWKPRESYLKDFTTLYANIKVQRISPESSSKVQLQIVLNDDSSHNFHFASDKGRSAQCVERNEIKDQLAELIPLHRNKSSKDLEEKNKLFKEQPELYQLYKDLVVTGIITAGEFWENQKTKSNTSRESDKQDTGIASGFLAELKPDMHGCNELRFNLTADSINSIFRMYPAVKDKYVKIVPTEMTEKEFWTEFFKSTHFHRDRIPKIAGTTSKDMFGDLAKKDEQEQLKALVDTFFDPLIDFSTTSPNPNEGYGMKSKDRGLSINEPLIKQFNHQSLMVLQNAQKRASTTIPSDMNKSETKKKRIREVIEFEELEEDEVIVAPILEIIHTDKFANSPQSTDGQNGHMNGHVSNNHANVTKFKQSLESWIPKLYNVISDDVARHVVSQITPGGSLMKGETRSKTDDSSANDYEKEMRKNYLSISELLRHFWCCFPVKTPTLEDKVRRMAASLEKYRDMNLSNFKCSLPSSDNHLGDHMTNMIDVALKKFKSWENRRVSTKGMKT